MPEKDGYVERQLGFVINPNPRIAFDALLRLMDYFDLDFPPLKQHGAVSPALLDAVKECLESRGLKMPIIHLDMRAGE